jgi:hypothetical protein
MKRLLASIAAVGLTGAAVIALATSAGGSTSKAVARDQEGASLEVETQQTSLHVNGNTITLTEDVFAHGKKVGVGQIVCVLTGPGPLALCQSAATLPRGEITSQGSVSVPPAIGSSFTTAITGGTGTYRNARGTIVTKPTSPTNSTTTIRVIGAANE